MTSKIKSRFFAALVCSVLTAILFSCAQVGSVEGGDKDTLAPYIKKSKPELYAAYFEGKKAKIKFNEFYSLDNVESKFLMSPPQDSLKPKIKVKGKWLLVKFKEPLKDDTTYTLQFADAVKDYNEGNKIDNFKFVFSTGAGVDSCAVSGTVYDAQTLERQTEMLVGLYGEQTGFLDSVPIKLKPDYITRTDTAGKFKIDNIRPGKYKIFGLCDINETQRFDLENEKVAFLKTIMVPKAERVRKVDSLYAGTILHLGEKGHRILDTLLSDTVIVQDLLYTTPNNIKMYSFEEVHLIQYITDRARDIRNRVKLFFNKTVGSDTVLITYVDDTLKSPNMVYDFNYGRDSLIVWFRDTADINNDTLQLRVTFSTLDSLKNPTTETDTISVKFKKKVANNSKDKKETKTENTGIDSLNFTIKTNFSGDFDIKKSIKVSIPIICDRMDTSLMRLYEAVDSTFEDDMNNKIVKSVRLDSANYRVIFKRPIMGDIVFYPTDSVVRPDWYTATYSSNRDTVEIEVTDSAMIHKSKFSNMLKYRNDYYLGQVQKIRDSVSTIIIDQKIISYDRPARDTVRILLEKSPSKGVEVKPINLDKIADDGIEVVQSKDHISLILRDTAAVHKDTLALKFNTFDRQVFNKSGKLIDKTLKDTLFAIYKIPYQKLIKNELIGTDSVRLVFERRFDQEPRVQLAKHLSKGSSWYSSVVNAKRDSLLIVSDDDDFLKLDTIKLAVTYNTFDDKENVISKTDTIQLFRPIKEVEKVAKDNGKGRRKSNAGLEAKKDDEQAKKNMAKANLMFPLQYTMEPDSMDSKNHILNYDFEPGKQYVLEIDDSTFNSIYNTPNLYVVSKAKIRALDYYGTININLSNLGNMEHYPDIDADIPPFENVDTSRTLHKRFNPNDTVTVKYTSLNEGQAIVCLCNEKGDIKYQQFTKQDGTVKFEYILPADYMVKIIHDVNTNGKWDTGKYIEGLYPERVIQFEKKQTVKSNWTTELEWKL